jgi:hypothetical protein
MRVSKIAVRLLLGSAAALAMIASTSSMADCDAQSGVQTAALVELYTSEGCSSCPPADRALSGLEGELEDGATAVPLALHVTYWDDLGWKDDYAQSAFDERQNLLVAANHGPVVYTPQFFVAGHEARDWHGHLSDLVHQINQSPAAGHIRVQARLKGDAALALRVEASASHDATAAVLYLALTENGLSSSASRGENRGRTLTHEYVVRTLVGPFNLRAGGLEIERDLALEASWNKSRLGVVAFIQSNRDGRVVQALDVQQCAAS